MYVGTTAQVAGSKGSLISLAGATGRVALAPLDGARRLGASEARLGRRRLVDPDDRPDGTLYAGTANPLPWGGTPALPNGGAYAGRDLYTDSLLALDARNGRLGWFDQVTRHDVRDYDLSLPPILARIAGRDLVIGGGKGGRVFAWDRSHPRARLDARRSAGTATTRGRCPRTPVTVCPGLLGGVLTPMALAHGRVFVPIVNLCMRGSDHGYENFGAVDYARRGRGELAALDATTGQAVWTRQFAVARLRLRDGGGRRGVHDHLRRSRVRALAGTGKTLWSVQEPAGSNACPAVAGDLLVVPAGAEPTTIAQPDEVVDGYAVR